MITEKTDSEGFESGAHVDFVRCTQVVFLKRWYLVVLANALILLQVSEEYIT